jgi:hypothetical protein
VEAKLDEKERHPALEVLTSELLTSEGRENNTYKTTSRQSMSNKSSARLTHQRGHK